ncbi:4-hydroxy-3-methylbut-2-enyl diphosphate reductase [Aequitasia blattaphilus]|uniref:4-hydroxy-3-methylbut-2-enyl diphosphate reductase n=1 Tax=Aequitasia blattaphilus TaxID=2949332 RepID=A0ABT1E5Z0_9FIRM|nr:4-hydroxy-3-methylbut-2-enyl diphosphate reductase [Aequitasia blattaphilus]MCP1101126.1 4-hydroxy-3-methylbut-2-enyl diphosphate reductase [Aequitasia blattaphilus]MCR8613766.1 4-hydroxy-3-methylbut-2-enyl diphosphate reductase [Aequitasia blattaphilus]
MKIILAKTAGFCFGVKRAVDTVYQEIQKESGERIYTYGPIIHNEIVARDLKEKGVEIIEDEEELRKLEKGVVILRSHGVEKKVYEILEEKNLRYVDATCPFVKRIHSIVEKETENEKLVIIIGNPSHPEVKGIKGWGKENVFIVENEQDAKNISLSDKKQSICIVSQTTFNHNKFKELVEIISKKGYDISVCNTICSATKERQEEARDIAAKVEAMIVIGDKHSSNTQKLFEICGEVCKTTFYIQTLDDLDTSQLRYVESIGITAGASTPNKIIEEVQKECQI